MDKIPSVIMVVGKKYYEFHEAIYEYREIGISKRIGKKNIPEGLVPFKSKLFVAHPDAIVLVGNENYGLVDLAMDLCNESLFSAMKLEDIGMLEMDMGKIHDLKAEDPVPDAMLYLAEAYSRSENRAALQSNYEIETKMGVFGYAYLQRIEYVVRPGETEVPEDLAHLDIVPVHYEYEDENDNNNQ
jgi:hypothetical protein